MGIFIGLGSNLGERRQNLVDAREMLGLRIVAASSIYETEPLDFLDQPWFLNQVIQIETDQPAGELLTSCQRVENMLGRRREIPKGPRVIDLDILFYGELVYQTEHLSIPHPAIPQRRFVLEPLNEIAPGYVHPVLKKTISDLLRLCPDHSVVRRL